MIWEYTLQNNYVLSFAYQSIISNNGIEGPEPLPGMRAPGALTDEYGNLLYRWDGEKPILDPIDLAPEVKEAKRVEKVKARFNAELFDLVYANRDDPSALAAAMCARVREIDAETTVEPTPVKELKR